MCGVVCSVGSGVLGVVWDVVCGGVVCVVLNSVGWCVVWSQQCEVASLYVLCGDLVYRALIGVGVVCSVG